MTTRTPRTSPQFYESSRLKGSSDMKSSIPSLPMRRIFVILFAVYSNLYTTRAQGFSVQTPDQATQCVATVIQWQGGMGPYYLAIVPPNSTPDNIQSFSGLTGESFTWIVNKPAGTSLSLVLTDLTTGQNAASSPFVVGVGPNKSCLGGMSGNPTTPSSTPSTVIATMASLGLSMSPSSAWAAAGSHSCHCSNPYIYDLTSIS
ncbi:hypothetical protein BC628DRAFT_1035812 [Trametes gibbosa]|nr:hypothetical protein BC628DRAFT_1035812 [Trametes gibbosa]